MDKHARTLLGTIIPLFIIFLILLIPVIAKDPDLIREGENVSIDEKDFKATVSPEHIKCSGYYPKDEGFTQKCCYERIIKPKKDKQKDKLKFKKPKIVNITSESEITDITTEWFEEYQINVTDYNQLCLDDYYNCSIFYFLNESKCNVSECITGYHLENKTRWSHLVNISFNKTQKTRTCFFVPYPSYGLFDDSFEIDDVNYTIALPTWNTTTQADWDLGAYENVSSNSSGALTLNQSVYPYDSNMFLWYHMDNDSYYNESDSIIFDFSDAENNGTLTGPVNANATANETGKFGRAYSFDGVDDAVNMGKVIDNWNRGTISMWFEIGCDAGVPTWWGKIVDGTHFIYLEGESGSECGIKFRSYDGSEKFSFITTTNAWIKDEWHMVTAVWDGTNALLYVDGEFDVSDTFTGNINLDTEDELGRLGYLGRHFNGSIDEVAIWNRSLSAEEIANLYRRKAGYYNSTIKDTSASQIYKNMTWGSEDDTDENNNITFQVRSCDDGDCSGESFVGPDNTTNTFFNESPGDLKNISDNQYFQFRSFFTRNNTYNPSLWNVSIDYEIAVVNTPPIVTTPTIVPVYPHGFDSLDCYLTPTDNETTDINVSFRWFKNDTHQDTYDTTVETTSGTETHTDSNVTEQLKGRDLWICEANPSDGELNGSKRNSSAMTIVEEPPFLPTPIIEQTKPLTNDQINCYTTPLDNETININVSFRWWKNDTYQDTFSSTNETTNNTKTYSYNITDLRADDSWFCEVFGTDGLGNSSKKNSSAIQISSQIPLINTNETIPFPNYNETVVLQINSTDLDINDFIADCNFNIRSPNGSNYTSHTNGTRRGDLWNSSSIIIDQIGNWTWIVNCTDSMGNSTQHNDTMYIPIRIDLPQNDTNIVSDDDSDYNISIDYTLYNSADVDNCLLEIKYNKSGVLGIESAYDNKSDGDFKTCQNTTIRVSLTTGITFDARVWYKYNNTEYYYDATSFDVNYEGRPITTAGGGIDFIDEIEDNITINLTNMMGELDEIEDEPIFTPLIIGIFIFLVIMFMVGIFYTIKKVKLESMKRKAQGI